MRSAVVFSVIVLLSLSILSGKEKKASTEAVVLWEKKDGTIHYTFSFQVDYKINKEAPFNFFLLDSSKKEISKVEWKSFSAEKENQFKYVSSQKENFAKYWFVACKYLNNEVVSCKTFSNVIEIK